MTTRHRRRSVQVEAIAPWVRCVVVLICGGGRDGLEWDTPREFSPALPFGVDTCDSQVEACARVRATRSVSAPDAGPTISANTMVLGSDLEELRLRHWRFLSAVSSAAIWCRASVMRRGSSRRHDAIDILAPRGTEVVAVEDEKSRRSSPATGGTDRYQFDPTETFVYYYAHLDAYAPGLKEGASLRKGDLVGTVGTTGNAPKDTPHRHFSIAKLDPTNDGGENRAGSISGRARFLLEYPDAVLLISQRTIEIAVAPPVATRLGPLHPLLACAEFHDALPPPVRSK